jgi:hypothetical protein
MNQAMQNEQLAAETTWEVSDAGVQISNRFGSYLLEWGSLNRLVTTVSVTSAVGDFGN